MKRLLLPLLVALSLPTAVIAEVDPKVAEKCMKAADFKGCVEAFSGKATNQNQELCSDLNKGLSIVKERIISGTSLMKLDINTNPLSDALAIAKINKKAISSCKRLVSDSQTILEMVRILRNQWNTEVDKRLTLQKSKMRGRVVWASPAVEINVNRFNKYAGGSNPAITGPGHVLVGFNNDIDQGFDYEMREFKGGPFSPCNVNYCGNYVIKSPLNRMFDVLLIKIDSVLEDREVDWPKGPEVKPIETITRSKKSVKKTNKSIKPVKINCDSPVWKNKPRCN